MKAKLKAFLKFLEVNEIYYSTQGYFKVDTNGEVFYYTNTKLINEFLKTK